MKTIQISQWTMLLATIFFVIGLLTLLFTGLDKSYIAMMFICIPICFLTQVKDFEKNQAKQMLVSCVLAVIIYSLDTNMYIIKLCGAEKLPNNDFGSVIWVTLKALFVTIVFSIIIIIICNPKIISMNLYLKKASEEK